MRFFLDLTITEEDYLAFNYFHILDSNAGKKQFRKSSIRFVIMIIAVLLLVFLVDKRTTFIIIYGIFGVLYTILVLLLHKPRAKRRIKRNIRNTQKDGQTVFDAVSKIEFYEDMLVEITSNKRTEQSYSGIERICILKDRYVFLYNSSDSAYVLPIPQINAQVDYTAFMEYLSQKCNEIEYY